MFSQIMCRGGHWPSARRASPPMMCRGGSYPKGVSRPEFGLQNRIAFR